ncbi:hypothetical protein Q8A67_016550 [Cirrhinus molitorella]|uniref:Uncharacterized protein n=1 Tax=Cirrhinus molitorella TaxID=172907 RepID=A0AA88PJU6_9TELE|nr:hypothetical protein Q8A67_016550 [Cirrhinus molitorella]
MDANAIWPLRAPSGSQLWKRCSVAAEDKSQGLQEEEDQVFKECFTSLGHLEFERKRLSHCVSPELF